MMTIAGINMGKDWKTTTVAYIKAIIILAATTPTLFGWIPDDILKYVVGIAGILYAAMAIVGGYQQKDAEKK